MFQPVNKKKIKNWGGSYPLQETGTVKNVLVCYIVLSTIRRNADVIEENNCSGPTLHYQNQGRRLGKQAGLFAGDNTQRRIWPIKAQRKSRYEDVPRDANLSAVVARWESKIIARLGEGRTIYSRDFRPSAGAKETL